MIFFPSPRSNLPFSRTNSAPPFMLIALLACSPLLSQQADDGCDPGAIVTESQVRAPVDAPEAPSGPGAAMGEGTMSLNVEDQEVRVILQNIAEIYKLKTSIPDALQWRTSVNLTDVTWQQAFDIILKQGGYAWAIVDGVIRIRQGTFDPRDPRVQVLPDGNLGIEFRDTPTKIIISAVARALDLNLVIPPDMALTSRMGIRLSNVSWEQVFRVVLTQIGYGYVIEGDIVIVRSLEQINSGRVDSWVFQLQFLEAEALGMLLSEVSGVKKVDTDTTANTVTVTGHPTRLKAIKSLIERLDQPNPQVN